MPEQQTQQGDPIDNLYQVAYDKKLFNGSKDEFKAKYNSPKAIDELYSDVKTSKLFTQDKFDFYDEYFPQHRESASFDRLHKAMKSIGYEGSEKDFKNEFSSDEGKSKLYHILNQRKLFTDSENDFNDAYFPSVAQNKATEKVKSENFFQGMGSILSQKKNGGDISQDGELPSKEGEIKKSKDWGNDIYKEGEVVDNSATRMHGGGAWQDAISKKYQAAKESINKLKGTPLFDESVRNLAQKTKEAQATNQAQADLNSRTDLGGMDNIPGIDPNTRNRVLSNQFAPREISQYNEHDYEVAKAEVGNSERSAANVMLAHDPTNKELQEHTYLLNHDRVGRDADKVEQNIKDIREGTVQYKDGVLVRPEGVTESIISGARQSIEGFGKSVEFAAQGADDRVAQLEKEYQQGQDPDEQVPVPKGMLAEAGHVVGGFAPMLGGGPLSTALKFGISGGVEGGVAKMKETYNKLRSQGYNPSVAYEEARNEGAKAGVADYFVGAGMGYAGQTAEFMVGKAPLNGVDWGSGWKLALKDVSKTLPHELAKLPAEISVIGAESGLGSIVKGEDEKQRAEAIKSNAGFISAFHAVGLGLSYAKGISMATTNSLIGGLSKLSTQHLDAISKAAEAAKFNTPEQVLDVIDAIKKRKEADAGVPDDVVNPDVRNDVAVLIEKRDELEEKKKKEDSAFAPETKEKIDEINQQILEKSKSKEAKEGPEPEEKKEEKPQPTKKESILSGISDIFGNPQKEKEALDNELSNISPKKDDSSEIQNTPKENPSLDSVDQSVILAKMKPITDNMVEVEREFENNGLRIDTDHDNEIVVLDKKGNIVDPEDVPKDLQELAAKYEKAVSQLGDFDRPSLEKSLAESRKTDEADAEVISTKTNDNAIQKPSPSSILPHTPEGTGEKGGERRGVGQSIEGEKPTEARTSEATQAEAKADEELKKETKPEVKMSFMTKDQLRKLSDFDAGVKEHSEIKEVYKKLKAAIECLWT